MVRACLKAATMCLNWVRRIVLLEHMTLRAVTVLHTSSAKRFVPQLGASYCSVGAHDASRCDCDCIAHFKRKDVFPPPGKARWTTDAPFCWFSKLKMAASASSRSSSAGWEMLHYAVVPPAAYLVVSGERFSDAGGPVVTRRTETYATTTRSVTMWNVGLFTPNAKNDQF